MKSEIGNIINKSGYALINVHENKQDKERGFISFTIGLQSHAGGPEFIFVNKSLDDVSDFIDKYLFFSKVGIANEKILEFSSLGGEKVNSEAVDQKIAIKFAPQLYQYHKDNEINVDPIVVWVGERDEINPFSCILG